MTVDAITFFKENPLYIFELLRLVLIWSANTEGLLSHYTLSYIKGEWRLQGKKQIKMDITDTSKWLPCKSSMPQSIYEKMPIFFDQYYYSTEYCCRVKLNDDGTGWIKVDKKLGNETQLFGVAAVIFDCLSENITELQVVDGGMTHREYHLHTIKGPNYKEQIMELLMLIGNRHDDCLYEYSCNNNMIN